MQIKTIKAVNFKGSSFTETLAPITQFYGPNFAGKSSRVEAITLALLGYLPGISRTGSATHKALASGNTMSVAVTGNINVCRTYEMDKRGSVKTTQPDTVVEAVALDAKAYLDLSGPERVKFLFQRASLPLEFTMGRLTETITANLKNIKLDENTEDSEAVIRELVEFVCHQSASTTTPQLLISNLVFQMGERKKLVTANTQRQEKTQQGLAQNADLAPVNENAAEALVALRDEDNAARINLGQLALAGKALRAELEELKQLAAKSIDTATATIELEELSQQKEKVFKLTMEKPDSTATAARKDAAQKVMTAAAQEYQRHTEELKRAIAERDTTQATKVCSKCGQSVVKLKEKLVATLEQRVAELTLAGGPIGERFEDATRALSTAAAEFQADLNRVNEWMENTAKFRDLSKRHADIQDRLTSNAKFQAAKDAIPALEEKLEAARKAWTDQEIAVAAIQPRLTAATEEHKRLIAQRANDQLRVAIRQELNRSRVEGEVVKQAAAMLAELQEKLVNETIGPLLRTANELCGSILKSPLVWQDGEIGMTSTKTGGFVPHYSFSGTEKALTYAAICIALAATTKTVKIVILDELGRLDAANKRRLVDTLCHLYTQGKIDQAVLIDTAEIDYQNDNFNAVPVGT